MSKREIKSLVVVLIVLGIFSLMFFLFKNKTKDDSDQIIVDNPIIELNNKQMYFTVKKYIEDLIINVNDNEKEVVFSVLDSKYIDLNNITLDNVINKINTFDGNRNYVSQKMYISSSINSALIYTSGKVFSSNNEGSDLYTIMKLDYNNSTYSIEITTREKYLSFIKTSKIDYADYTIDNNNTNVFAYQSVSTIDVCSLYLTAYKYNAKYNIGLIYNKLNEGYKKDKYPTISSFTEYINSNFNLIINSILKEYQKVSTEDYEQYTCVDNNDIKYVFDEKSLLNYTIVIE